MPARAIPSGSPLAFVPIESLIKVMPDFGSEGYSKWKRNITEVLNVSQWDTFVKNVSFYVQTGRNVIENNDALF